LPWVVTPVTVPLMAGLMQDSFTWGALNATLANSGVYFQSGVLIDTGLDVYSHLQLTIVWIPMVLASTASAILAYSRARAYSFSARRLWLWTGLSFALGPTGFVLMLSLIEWPACERCPSCGRRRVMTREQCEHCGTPFPAPPDVGV